MAISVAMAQSDLLQRAKQGDPVAIAALMNKPLQSQGITATVVVIQDCLHVSFTAARLLNQTTFVNFLRKGIGNLNIASIKTVKVYGLKTGNESPAWLEEFSLAASSETTPAGLEASTPYPTETYQTEPTSSSYDLENALLNRTLAQTRGDFGTGTQTPAPNRETFQLENEAAYIHNELQPRNSVTSSNLILSKPAPFAYWRHPKYLFTAALVTVAAFLLGGAIAIIAKFPTESLARLTSGNVPAPNNSEKMAIQPNSEQDLLNQQTEVKKYLSQMNQAQQAFYQSNSRFASNLEELERSASVLFQSRSYTFNLTISDKTQSHLIAVPKRSGLHSYIGAVLLTKAKDGTEATVSTICETHQPSQHPPQPPKLVGNQLQCP